MLAFVIMQLYMWRFFHRLCNPGVDTDHTHVHSNAPQDALTFGNVKNTHSILDVV
jgi:hypothetical protein